MSDFVDQVVREIVGGAQQAGRRSTRKPAEPTEDRAVERVEVQRAGRQIILPDGMSIPDAVASLVQRHTEEETTVAVSHRIDCYPLDGAIAFQRVLDREYGWTQLAKTPGFFKDNPPTLVSVPTGPGAGDAVQVPWGRVKVPNVDGFLTTSLDMDPPAFIISGEVKARHRDEIARVARLTQEALATDSIYRGKALRVSWAWDRDGEDFNVEDDCPKFLDLSRVDEAELVFDAATTSTVELGLFAPIEHTAACRAAGIPLKRGVLLEGPYGVGKTLTASVTAKKAVANGWTYVYVEDIRDLQEAINFALRYQPAVVFAEDVDRTMGEDRDVDIDAVLNILDGIRSKGAELVTILTTNNVNAITPALLRPGRLDTIVSVRAPDAAAAIRLVRLYGRGLVDEDADLTAVGERLAGQIPAVIREVVERSKLAAVHRTSGALARTNGDGHALRMVVSPEDLVAAADQMKRHLELLAPREASGPKTPAERLGAALADVLGGQQR